MSTEYWIVNPRKKEIFYLGKHWDSLDGINQYTYKAKAEIPTWEDYHEVVLDLIGNNCNYLQPTDTLGRINRMAYEIFQWCYGEEVYVDSDASDNCVNWSSWDETGDMLKIIEEYQREEEEEYGAI